MPVNAAPKLQLRLLDLQDVDSTLDRLAMRRRTLPELAGIEECDKRLGALADEIVTVATEVSDIAREQRKLELDVDTVRQRSARDQQRLDTGAVTSAKDLEALQHEVASLARRQGVLEDDVLEVMERREEAEGRLLAMQAEQAAVREQLAVAEARRDAAFGEIDSEISLRQTERGVILPGLPEELVVLYTKIRGSAAGGVAAAPVLRKRCEGCHLELSGSELDEVRNAPADEVLRCESCRRILVRTAESGLS